MPDAAISLAYSVILSNAKDLEVCTTFHRLADLEILHFVQNDILLVILSNAKDLLAGNTLCALSLVGFEGILHFVQNDKARVTARHGTKKVGSPLELPTS